MRASARSEVKLLERISSSNRLRPLQQRNRWTIPRQRTCVGRLPTYVPIPTSIAERRRGAITNDAGAVGAWGYIAARVCHGEWISGE